MKRNATTQESGSEDGCTRRRSRITALLASFLAVACATETPPERTGETGPAARPNYTIRLDSESSDPGPKSGKIEVADWPECPSQAAGNCVVFQATEGHSLTREVDLFDIDTQ